MGDTLDLFIGLAAVAIALFGIGSGSLIYVQFSGAMLGLMLLVASVLGGLFGVAKLALTRGSSESPESRRSPSGSTNWL